jgi:hypothetical protein
VPYVIKDLGFFETGEPATLGSSLFKDFVVGHGLLPPVSMARYYGLSRTEPGKAISARR